MTMNKYFTEGLVEPTQNFPRCAVCQDAKSIVINNLDHTFYFKCERCIQKRIASVPAELREIVSDFARKEGIPFEKAMTLIFAAKKELTK